MTLLRDLVMLGMLVSCSGRPRRHVSTDGGGDAGRDAGADANVPLDSGDDGGGALDGGSDGSPDAAPPPRAAGGCSEVTTFEEDLAWRVVTARIDSFLEEFGVLVVTSEGRGFDEDCELRARDLNGLLLSDSVVSEAEACADDPDLVISDARSVLFLNTGKDVWAGTMEGDGAWVVDGGWPTAGLSSTIMLTEAGEDVLFAAREGTVVKLDWSGIVAAQVEGLPGAGKSWARAPGIEWSGTVLGVATREQPRDEAFDRAYFQRFDADLLPIDPAPILVAEFDEAADDQTIDERSPILVGWDGSEFGVVVTWVQGPGDWGEPAFTDVYRYGEAAGALGSFDLDRGGFDVYTGDQLLRLWSLSDRVVVMHDADYFIPGEDGEGDVEWGGAHLAPIDLTTGDRAGEDGRLWNGWRTAPMARNGNRLGILWDEREYTKGGPGDPDPEWIEHLMFTILDCTEVFGVE